VNSLESNMFKITKAMCHNGIPNVGKLTFVAPFVVLSPSSPPRLRSSCLIRCPRCPSSLSAPLVALKSPRPLFSIGSTGGSRSFLLSSLSSLELLPDSCGACSLRRSWERSRLLGFSRGASRLSRSLDYSYLWFLDGPEPSLFSSLHL
jgi:hypothetical protein